MRTGEDPETAEQGTGEFNHWQVQGTVGAACRLSVSGVSNTCEGSHVQFNNALKPGYSGYRFPWTVCLLNSALRSSGLSCGP